MGKGLKTGFKENKLNPEILGKIPEPELFEDEKYRKRKRKISITATSEVLRFKSGSAEFPVKSHKLLSKIGSLLRTMPVKKVVIEGHSDNIGNPKFNKSLSFSRAKKIERYFTEIEELPKNNFRSFDYGEEKPISDNSTPKGRMKNRRVEIILQK